MVGSQLKAALDVFPAALYKNEFLAKPRFKNSKQTNNADISNGYWRLLIVTGRLGSIQLSPVGVGFKGFMGFNF
jgi:hypothetical protein